MAEGDPGAWLGLKIAVLIFLVDTYRPTFLTRLFGLSLMSLTSWVHRVNREGARGVLERPRLGRPTALTARLRRQLTQHLEQSAEPYGLPRAVWDGSTLEAHLRRHFGLDLNVR